MILLILNPITDSLNLIGIIGTIIILVITVDFLFSMGEILRGRSMLDLVPSEYRNSVYSLIPTLINIIAIPLFPFAGIVTEVNGLSAGLTIPLILGIIGSILMILSFHYKNKREPTEK